MLYVCITIFNDKILLRYRTHNCHLFRLGGLLIEQMIDVTTSYCNVLRFSISVISVFNWSQWANLLSNFFKCKIRKFCSNGLTVNPIYSPHIVSQGCKIEKLFPKRFKSESNLFSAYCFTRV